MKAFVKLLPIEIEKEIKYRFRHFEFGSNSLHKGSIEILHTYAFGDVTKLETPQSKETRKAYLEDFFRKLGPRQAVLE